MKSRRSGKWWISGLIQKLWEVAWDLWDYWNSILHHQENCFSIEKECQSKCIVIKLFNKLLTKNLLPPRPTPTEFIIGWSAEKKLFMMITVVTSGRNGARVD